MLERLAGAALLVAACFVGPARAADAASVAGDPAVEARVKQIASQLRCLVCQNETIAESSAELAQDLRAQVRRMLGEGRSEDDIVQYMTERYGDFVLYRPPLKASTLVLWCGPFVLLIGGGWCLYAVLKRRAGLGDEHFEPDPADDDGSPRP
jgi:cytochrome c-type biogenesis protein CcmH